MKLVWLIFFAGWLLGAPFCRAADTNSFFAQGTVAYQGGEFAAAAAAFQKTAEQHPSVGAFLNLGLAEWQRGHAGPAMLAWERALWLDPYDRPARENLRFAREALQLDGPELKWFETASTWLPSDAWVWLAEISLWLAVGMVTLPAFLRRRKAGWQQAVAAIALGVFLVALVANLGVLSRTQFGVILRKDALLRLTPTHDSEIVTTLAAGEPARQLRSRGDYLLIRTPNTEGWVRRNEFQLICPE